MTSIKNIYKLICLGFLMLFLFSETTIAQAPTFTIGSAANVTTATVTLPITANKFTQILAWQGSINWNNSKLTYVSTNSVVSQLNGIQFNASLNSSKGLLSFFWLDNSLQPQSIADSTVLFTITFNVIANAAGSTDVSFTNNPTSLQLADVNGNQISGVNYINGNVSFANEILPPEFTVGSITNVSTSAITVPVTTKNFIQLLACQGSIVWDNTRLTFVSTSAITSQLNGIQFNNSLSGNLGQLSFLWIDANLLSQTISDSAILFNITFNVVGSTTGITNINFANSPTLLQTSDAIGTPIANTVYNNGIISFPGSILPPAFIIPTIAKVETINFSVPVIAKNFTQLKAMQGSITWDNRKYNYAGASSSLTQLNGILFNASVSGDYGTLSYVWADANSATQSITDNSVLFTISFNRVCGAVGTNNINFTNTPTSQLVVNAGDSAVTNTVYFNGILSIPSIVTPAVYISTPSNILCVGASPVLSTILSNEGTSPTYQWYKNKILINGAVAASYTSSSFNNNDSVKCVITSNVACAATNVATSNVIGLYQKNAIKDTVAISGCNSVLYKTIVYTSNTTIKDTLKTVYGCDSIYRLAQIFIVPLTPTNQTISLSGCNSVLYNNITYTSSTTKYDTIRNLQGCDSIYNTINIAIDNNISGRIRHITKGTSIQKVNAFLSGSNASSIVVNNGNFDFNCLPSGTNGTIRLSKNNDISKSNGVTSVDVLLTQRHILNTTKLNSAYKLIAADVTGDKNINSTDVLRMKRLILGTDTTFTSSTKGNRLWEFVDSTYIFPDTTNPFPFKDSISFINLTSNKINQTFIGVKLGDVNYDWNATVARGVAIDNVELVYHVISTKEKFNQTDFSGTSLRNDDIVKIPIAVKNFKDIAAMQYTLHFDNTKYEFVNLEGFKNLQGFEYNATQANITGNIAMLWTDKNAEPKTLADGTEIFTLVLKSNGIGNLGLGISNEITEIEAWDKDYQKHNIVLTKSQLTINYSPLVTNKIWSVSPNPTSGNVVVNIVSKENKIIVFELSNAEGKTLYTQSFEAVKNNNHFHLNLENKSNLPSGLYYLKAIGLNNANALPILLK